MSAYICGDFHISYIVSAGIWFKAWVNLGGELGRTYINEENAPYVFEVLKRENVRSVNHRYRENNESDDGGRFELVLDTEPIRAMKAVNGLEYQSCEHPEWAESLALDICRAIKEAAINNLPGYDKSDGWHIDKPEGYVAPVSLFQLAKQARRGRP